MSKFLSFLLLIFVFSAHDGFARSCKKDNVCVKIKRNLRLATEIEVINRKKFPVSVLLEFEPHEILRDSEEFPKMVFVEAGKKKRIKKIRLKKLSLKQKYKVRYKWLAGNYLLKRSYYAYDFPYEKGKSYMVSQAFGPGSTHKSLTNYAVDWNMQINSKIHAARAGYVTKVVDSFYKSGRNISLKNKANYIQIVHDDGSFALYAHLRKDGVVIKEGQYVKLGQLIGYSGNVGYSSGPHLHFEIAIPHLEEGELVNKSIPFKFINCKNKIPFTVKVRENHINC